jgi:hypothetical protein
MPGRDVFTTGRAASRSGDDGPVMVRACSETLTRAVSASFGLRDKMPVYLPPSSVGSTSRRPPVSLSSTELASTNAWQPFGRSSRSSHVPMRSGDLPSKTFFGTR